MYPVPDAWKNRFVRGISVMIVLKYGCFHIGNNRFQGRYPYYQAFKKRGEDVWNLIQVITHL
jgi:hypothetical protein